MRGRAVLLALLPSLALPVLLLTGCVEDLLGRSGGFDARPMTVQTVDLFDQRQPSRLSKKSWRGDWLFRRDRLELIDQELRNTKPDILLVQELLEKTGSAAESDRAILGAGALVDDDWRVGKVAEFADTQDVESLAIAVSTPSRFLDEPAGRKETWVMGTDGYLMAATVEYEGQPVLVFDVQMPTAKDSAPLWYTFVQDRVLEKLRRDHRCGKRVVIGGYMPGDEANRRYTDFLSALQLKDVATGFCQVASRCYTATPANDIFAATLGDESPARTDKLFVPVSAYVYSSSRNFQDSEPAGRYVKEFGLQRLFPTQRFGWVSQVRLARCTPSELEGSLP